MKKGLMNIEQFVNKSEGEWKSMRSGHSLAFQQFEEVISLIKIKILSKLNKDVCKLVEESNQSGRNICSPFIISWMAESNWEINNKDNFSSGSSVFVPIPDSEDAGIMLSSSGYSEKIRAISQYKFSDDGTLIISTPYTKTTSEERIWFVSQNVRFRSSVLISSESSAILQSSHASEVRKLEV